MKKLAVAKFNILSRNLPGGTQEYNRNLSHNHMTATFFR
jgi:hypothetical protein